MTRRHGTLKSALTELARSCGYHVEIEPHFPLQVEYQFNSATGCAERRIISQPDLCGDLLLLRNGSRQLVGAADLADG